MPMRPFLVPSLAALGFSGLLAFLPWSESRKEDLQTRQNRPVALQLTGASFDQKACREGLFLLAALECLRKARGSTLATEGTRIP